MELTNKGFGCRTSNCSNASTSTGVPTSKRHRWLLIVSLAMTLEYSLFGIEARGCVISVHSAQEHNDKSSSRYTLCLRYHGLLPNSSHCLIDFAFHFSMSTLLTFFTHVLVFALSRCKLASLFYVELMTHIRFFSGFPVLPLTSFVFTISSINPNPIWRDDGLVVSGKLFSVGK